MPLSVNRWLEARLSFRMIKQAYANTAMSNSTVFEWHKLFWEKMELVEEDERAGCPSTSLVCDIIERSSELWSSVVNSSD